MTAYYNEFDPNAAAWLRELIKHGHIAPGEVDERSIEDVSPDDLRGFTQCHFFAGIGGWSLALRMAGWPDDRPVWTGSCPCQPFSAAGKGAGFSDERHLWPAFHWLIGQCEPPVVFGEQVASTDGLKWLDLVSADLERAGYAVGAADLCAAGVGAPHIRQRLYWAADANCRGWQETGCHTARNREKGARWPGDRTGDGGAHVQPARLDGPAGGLADADSAERKAWFGNNLGVVPGEAPNGCIARCGCDGWTSPLHSHWRDADWLGCRDGKWRPVEPGTFPLAHGLPARVGRLRGYGNAIVPQVAEAFVRAYLGG